MPRWRLTLGRDFLRYVDARDYSTDSIDGTRFVNDEGDVVFTISAFVRGWVSIDPVPTARLRGGPRDGQVTMMPMRDAPPQIYFEAAVALGPDGNVLAPVPPHEVADVADVYIHAVDDCACGYRYGYQFSRVEHTYGWANDPDTYRPRYETKPERNSRG